jgi:hypothetical protein
VFQTETRVVADAENRLQLLNIPMNSVESALKPLITQASVGIYSTRGGASVATSYLQQCC